MRIKVLFLCSRNRWRSPTAEALLRGHPHYEARSAGTAAGARVRLTAAHLAWADLILCMERTHAARVRESFPEMCAGRPLVVLGIPDDYPFMDPALLELFRAELPAHLPHF